MATDIPNPITNFPAAEELSAESTLSSQLLTTLRSQILTLREKQDLSAPDIHTWMQELNINIRLNPELIHLLPDEDRATLYQAVIELSKIAIAPPVKAPKAPKPAKPAKEKQGKKVIMQFDNLQPLDNLDFLT